ncbi:MAG: c-type cytochrome domain-containing protein [Cyclobacteriaceae bacterium]|nr:c-type cytochrome domain-containing protein [Cyclobacteriaceae bacterium]
MIAQYFYKEPQLYTMLTRQNTLLFLIMILAFAIIWLMIWRHNREGASADGFKALPRQISFNFHVKPILSDKCFTCHGPDAIKREAGLRFDMEASAKGELPESPGKFAILPGKADESELVKRIFSTDTDLQMPPVDSNLKPTEEGKGNPEENGLSRGRHMKNTGRLSHQKKEVSRR